MKRLNEKEKNSIEAWVSLIWYNGSMSWITDIINSLNNAGNGSADFPSTWEWEENGGCLFWEWLVLMYGDYGTSPRMGWIIPENVKPLKDFLQKQINDMRGW